MGHSPRFSYQVPTCRTAAGHVVALVFLLAVSAPPVTHAQTTTVCCDCTTFCVQQLSGKCGPCTEVPNAACVMGTGCVPFTVTPTVTPTDTPTSTHTASPTPTATPTNTATGGPSPTGTEPTPSVTSAPSLPVQCLTIQPNGPGSFAAQNLPSSGCTENWQCVQSDDGDVSYVFSAQTMGGPRLDLYTLADVTPRAEPIARVRVHVLSRSTNGSAGITVVPQVSLPGQTPVAGQPTTVTGTYADAASTYPTNPFANLPWTWDDINALQGGMALSVTPPGDEARTTQLFVEVCWAPPTPSPTITPTPTDTATATPTPLVTDTPTLTPTATASPTPPPTDTPTPVPPLPSPTPRPIFDYAIARTGENQWLCAFNLQGDSPLLLSSATRELTSLASTQPLTLRDLYKAIYIPPGLGAADYDVLRGMVALGGSLEQFVSLGGVAVINLAGTLGDQMNVAPGGVGFAAVAEHEAENILLPSHPYISGLGLGGEPLALEDFTDWHPTDYGTLTNLPVDATVLLQNTTERSWAEYSYGAGKVIVTTLSYCWADKPSSQGAPTRNLFRYGRFYEGGAQTPAPTVTSTATFTSTATRTTTRTRTPTPTGSLPPSRTPTLSFLPGDLNGDQTVDESDLPDLIQAIFSKTPPPAADVNRDGRVTAADIAALISLLSEGF